MNSATPLLTSASEYSNSAAIRFASAWRAILCDLCGLDMGGSVGNGGGFSQVVASITWVGREYAE